MCPKEDPELKSFREIAEKLNMSHQRVFQVYESGMKKIRDGLREDPELAEQLFDYLTADPTSGRLNLQSPKILSSNSLDPDL